MASVEVAAAYVSLVPSARGFGAKVEQEIGSSLDKVANRQGDKFAKGFADKAAKSLDNFGKKATLRATAPIVAGFGFAIKAASDLSESINKTDVVFGESSKIIHDFAANAAKDLGISKRQAEEAAGTFGNLFVSMKIGAPQAADMSTKIVQLASDLASFNNANPADVLEALRAGLVGETEPLRRFGINLNDAALREEALRLGLVKTTKDVLPPAAKAQAAYSEILKQSTTAQGDFARTSDGLANQQRILKARLEDTAASVGTKLLPAGLKVVEFANDVVSAFSEMPDEIQNVTIGILGIAALAGPVAIAGSRIITITKGIGTAFDVLTLKASSLQLAAGGVGLALAGIGFLAIGISQTREAFRRMAQAATDDMGKAVNQLALFSGSEKDVAVNAYMAAVGVEKMVKATTGLEGREFGAELVTQSKAAREELDRLSDSSGVSRERIVQLADSLGINLAKATKDQREELAAAITEVGRAITPTERLEAAQEALGNEVSTTAEKFDAFKEALDAALGVQLTAEEASIRYADRFAALKVSISENGTQTGVATEKQRLLSGALLDVVSAAGDEVDALVKAGKISADASVQKQELINRLEALKREFPALVPKIDEYIVHVKAIPDEKNTHLTVTGVEAAAAALQRFASAELTVTTRDIHGRAVRQRRLGGPVEPSSLYEVTEGGIPELLRQGSRTYLMPGSRGTVIPSSDLGADTALGGQALDGVPLENVIVIDGDVFARVASVAMRERQVAYS